MGSISSLLHTLQVSQKIACSIFRHVWTGFSAVCLPPSLLAVSPSVSLPLSWPGSLKWRPNINICHMDGKEEVNLSLTSSFFPRFSLSVTCLLISYCFFYPLSTVIPEDFLLFCLPLSRLFSLPVVTFDPTQLACVSGTCLSKMAFFVFVYPLFSSYGPFLRLMGLFDWILCGCSRWLPQILLL